MTVHPLVSVVIPTYRRAGLVTRAIQSVQNQTYKNIQVIIVDDGSPDNTAEVIRELNNPSIRYIRHERNMGQAAGRNSGIRAATGEYVAFLDDDDEWRPNKIEKQLEFLNNSGCDAVLCASYVNKKGIRRHHKEVVTLADLKGGNEFAAGSGLLARTSVVRAVCFDESINQGEDWDELIRLAERYRIGYINEPLYDVDDGWHQRRTNIARNLSIDESEKRMTVIYKHRDFFGPFWFRHHIAMTLLAYIGYRKNKMQHLIYTIRRCGLFPVSCAFWTKIMRKAGR